MNPGQVSSREVARIVAVALLVAALAVLLVIILLHTRTPLRWAAAAIFLALALNPAVDLAQRITVAGRTLPRWLAILFIYLLGALALVFLILHVFPPIVRDIEGLAKKLPSYVTDLEHWAEDNEQFRDLNDKYKLTATLSDQASSLPSQLGSAAGTIGSFTVKILNGLLATITVATLTFFLLLDGKGMFQRGTGRLNEGTRERVRRTGVRIAGVVRAYVTVNVALAVGVGLLTFAFLEIAGFHLALPMAVLVAFLDLVPLIGLTVGGFLVAVVLVIDGGPGDAILWLILFLVYQQLQDRVLQPLLYKGGALKVNPAVAILAVIVGAELAGVLGALLAIPTAASLGVILDELLPRSGGAAEPEPAE